jgi:hypothetical protein
MSLGLGLDSVGHLAGVIMTLPHARLVDEDTEVQGGWTSGLEAGWVTSLCPVL